MKHLEIPREAVPHLGGVGPRERDVQHLDRPVRVPGVPMPLEHLGIRPLRPDVKAVGVRVAERQHTPTSREHAEAHREASVPGPPRRDLQAQLEKEQADQQA